MVKGNGIYESKIENMNPNLRLVERVDVYDTGEETWGIKDLAGNRTPLFENEVNMVPINENACLLVGQFMGEKKLYCVTYHEENGLSYKILMHKDVEKIENANEEYAIITNKEGQYFFNKFNLEKTSDVFTRIHNKDNCWVYENEYFENGYCMRLLGAVTEDGKIDEESIALSPIDLASVTVVPLMETEKDYDVISKESMNSELNKKVKEYFKSREELIDEVVRLHKNVKQSKKYSKYKKYVV